MELSTSFDTIVYVKPASTNIQCLNLDDCQINEETVISIQNGEEFSTIEGSHASTSCDQNCKEMNFPAPNCDHAQEFNGFADEVKESKVKARQKVCNVMRSMQQTYIAELFPIADSRETTEGSEDQVICRICHTGGDEILIAPCKCIGTAQFVHATCLLTWFKKSVKNQCELCQHQVPIRKSAKPVSEWKRPEDKPIPVIWFLVFFVGLCLNVLSIHVNASESCQSTACIIFYVVNGFGIVLDAAFLYFWCLKCMLYWRKWCAINQNWFITDTTNCYIPVLTSARRNKSQEFLNHNQEGLNPVIEMTEWSQSLDPVQV